MNMARTHNHEVDRGNYYWSTQNGKSYLVKDLSDTHLINIIKYVKQKNDPKMKELVEFLQTEQVYRGNNEISILDYPMTGTPQAYTFQTCKKRR